MSEKKEIVSSDEAQKQESNNAEQTAEEVITHRYYFDITPNMISDRGHLTTPLIPMQLERDQYETMGDINASGLEGNLAYINRVANNETSMNNVGEELAKRDLSKECNHNGKMLGSRYQEFVMPKSRNLEGKAAIMAMKGNIDMSGVFRHQLIHSGFSITLGNIYNTDIVALEFAVTKEKNQLGRKTLNLAYSYLSITLVRIITEFIVKHIHESTLDVPNEEILNYVVVQDLFPLFVSLLGAMKHDGYRVTIPCSNTAKLENKQFKCTAVHTASINMDNIIVTDWSSLNDDQKTQLSKFAPNSLTIEDVTNYQASLPELQDKTYELVEVNGMRQKVILGTMDVMSYILIGAKWLRDIGSIIEDITDPTIDDEKKTTVIGNIINAEIGILNSYLIKKFVISIDDNEDNDRFVENRVDIDDFIRSEPTTGAFITALDKAYVTHLNNQMVSMVAFPTYECSNCKKDQAPTDANQRFAEYVPINVLQYFLASITLKLDTGIVPQ